MCGVAGAIGVPDAAHTIKKILHGQQNRGEFSWGIFTYHNSQKHHERFLGTVSDTCTEAVLDRLPGDQAIGHNRYPTVEAGSNIANIQPLAFRYHGSPLAMVHNGNFTNAKELEKSKLREVLWKSELDTEAFLQLVVKEGEGEDLLADLENALRKMHGSCSAVVMRPDELIAMRDPSGNRPLMWAKKGDGYVVASETAGLDAVGILPHEIHEVLPGEIISFSATGVKKRRIENSRVKCQQCLFELFYFCSPHSKQFGIRAKEFRIAVGEAMARLHSIKADVIIGVPDSALLNSVGFAKESTVPLDNHIIHRRHNTGRSFTQHGQRRREKVAEEKSSFDSIDVAGKVIILVDDSLVRGLTTKKLIAALMKRGALAVHVVIVSPPVKKPCHTGINTPTEEELIANQMGIEEIRQTIGAASLRYMTLEILRTIVESFGVSYEDFCKACWDGQYWHHQSPG